MGKYLLTLLAVSLTGCQFNHTLPIPENTNLTGYHGAHGCAYIAGRDAALLAKSEDDCTDEEWAEEYQDIPGQGYYDSEWSGSHADELAKG